MNVQHPTRFVGLISRPKLSGAGRHAGVLLPDGRVAHMTPEGAAIVLLLAAIFAGSAGFRRLRR